MIAQNAQPIHKKCLTMQAPRSFIASNGSIEKFVVKNGLSVRRGTADSQENKINYLKRLLPIFYK